LQNDLVTIQESFTGLDSGLDLLSRSSRAGGDTRQVAGTHRNHVELELKPMRILIVDDHEVIRRGVRGLLATERGLEVCGEAADGREAIAKAQQLKPDAILMDISMPQMNGLDATREILRLFPEVRIVILSQHDTPAMMREALNAGAKGYVVKTAIGTELLAALHKLRQGEASSLPELVRGDSEHVDVKELLQRSTAFETALRQSEQRLRALVDYQSAVMNNLAEGPTRWMRRGFSLHESCWRGHPGLDARGAAGQQDARHDPL
jgi:two-component system response regulator NreC